MQFKSFTLSLLLGSLIVFNSFGQTPWTVGSEAKILQGGPFVNSVKITLTAAMFKSSGKNTPFIPQAMANKPITALGWNLVTPPSGTVTGTFRVWLKHNTANTLPFGTNFETEKAGATLFFMGTVTLPSTPGWWTITGNMGSTFAWDGTAANHLEVLTEFTRSGNIGYDAGWEGTAVYGQSGTENALYCFTNTLTDYGQYNPVMNSGGSIRPNMQFMAGDGCTSLPAAPIANTPQNYCTTGKVSNLTATGENIRWYAASTGGVAYQLTTALTDGGHYYASQNVNACESFARTDVKAVDICNVKYTVGGKIIYNNKASNPMTNTKVYLKSNEGVKLDSATTDANGDYLIQNVKMGNYKLDCKTDKAWGSVSPVDALLINKYYMNLYTQVDDLKKKAIDVNNDKSVSPVDALFIIRRYIGTIANYSIADWQFENPDITVNSSNITQNIKALCAGDIDASYIPE